MALARTLLYDLIFVYHGATTHLFTYILNSLIQKGRLAVAFGSLRDHQNRTIKAAEESKRTGLRLAA